MTTDQPRADAAHVRAPWTNEQVDALNRFQREGRMHPFTCGGEHTGGAPVLIASHDGWHCPHAYCTYRQDWAHAFMADPDAWPKPFLRTDLGTEFVRQADNPDPDALARFEATLAPDGDGQADTDPGTGSLRDRVAGAIRAAAHWCDGECGKTERECDDAHPLHAWVWTFGVVSGVHGPPEAFADAVLAAVRPEMDALADDRDRLAAELSTRRPGDALWVRAYGEEIRAAQQSAENMQGRAAALAVRVDQLIARLGEYADRGIANGQRAERAEAALGAVAAERDGWVEALNNLLRIDKPTAALARVRELHRPVTWPAEPPVGAHPDAEYFDGPVTVCAAESDDPAGRTHWTPWPCATICALDDIPTYSNPGNALDDPIPTDTTEGR